MGTHRSTGSRAGMAGYPPAGQGYQGQGGYGAPHPQGGNQLVYQWFQAVDVDRSGQINALELQQALVNGNMSKFSEEACRMMIDLFDANRSGTIDVNEFSQTFVQNVLTKYDPKTRRLALDNFIVVCFSLKRLTDSFKRRDREMRGQALIGYEDFVGLALGAHQ